MTLTFKGHTQQLCPTCGSRQGEQDDCGDCQTTGYEYVEANVLLDHAPLVRGLDRLAVEIHKENREAGWWNDLKSGEDLLETRNRGEMLMLAVTELDEAQDARNSGIYDDKLPHRLGFEVELADAAIRLLDTLGAEQRRGGQQPLIIYHPEHRVTSVGRAYREVVPLGHGEDLMWIVGALSKALDEGYRKRRVRIARYWITTALFRIIALCAYLDIDLFNIIAEKREFNRNRADHKPENRRLAGGKQC